MTSVFPLPQSRISIILLREQQKMAASFQVSPPRSAVLDDAHVGDIRGAFGTIPRHDTAPRANWWARLRTLMAIFPCDRRPARRSKVHLPSRSTSITEW